MRPALLLVIDRTEVGKEDEEEETERVFSALKSMAILQGKYILYDLALQG